MKKLITLFVSAALLYPIWAGAQTTTTPSALPLMTWTGLGSISSYQLIVEGGLARNDPGTPLDVVCPITSINLSVVMPNNSSPVMAANGWAGGCNANGSHAPIPLSGLIFALRSDGNPVKAGETISIYQANLTATFNGFTNPFICTAQPTNLRLSCQYQAYQSGEALMFYTGGGDFTLVRQ
jgi:hypothetical protein